MAMPDHRTFPTDEQRRPRPLRMLLHRTQLQRPQAPDSFTQTCTPQPAPCCVLEPQELATQSLWSWRASDSGRRGSTAWTLKKWGTESADRPQPTDARPNGGDVDAEDGRRNNAMSKRKRSTINRPLGGFAEHRSFAACFCDEGDSHALMHHLTRLEQAYRSRLPAELAAETSLLFALSSGRDAALQRLANLFDAQWRKRHLPPETAKAVSKALAGPNPQGQCWKGWRLSGFGDTQVCAPAAAIAHGAAIIRAFGKMWGTAVVCEGVPHTILKPPGGSELAGHIDSGSLLEMYLACQHLLAAGLSSPVDWARKHGCQALVHWEGARPSRAASRDGAHTCGLSQLTTARYLVLLSMFHPNHTHADVPTPSTVDGRAATLASEKSERVFDPHAIAVDATAELAALLPRAQEPTVARFIAKGGPVFAPFFHGRVLAALNQALAFVEHGVHPPTGGSTARWIEAVNASGRLEAMRAEGAAQRATESLEAVAVAPMCPPAGGDDKAPICVSWLRGWPHMAKRGGVRLTFVPGLQPQPTASAAGLRALECYEAERRRSVGRALLMAKAEYAKIRADPVLGRPIAGGSVHSHPEHEEQMHRDYDRCAYATLPELEEYDRTTEEMNSSAAAALRRKVGKKEARRKAKG